MENRTLVAEWWEVWWRKPGCVPVLVTAYGAPPPRCHRDAYGSREEALRVIRAAQNQYHKIVHVKRYRMVKRG